MVYLRRRHTHSPAPTATAPKGLPIEAIAPPFELVAYDGGTTTLAELLAHGKPLLLIFTSPNCGPCVVLFEEIKEWQQSHGEKITIALLSSGTIKQNFVNVARNSLGQMLLQEKREVAEKYGANVTPTAVVVNTSGRIASPVAAGAEEIRYLLATALVNSPASHNHEHLH
jgi:thiol-disulfide isomerase/thioredoxin